METMKKEMKVLRQKVSDSTSAHGRSIEQQQRQHAEEMLKYDFNCFLFHAIKIVFILLAILFFFRNEAELEQQKNIAAALKSQYTDATRAAAQERQQADDAEQRNKKLVHDSNLLKQRVRIAY